jgi:hypothetical protein
MIVMPIAVAPRRPKPETTTPEPANEIRRLAALVDERLKDRQRLQQELDRMQLVSQVSLDANQADAVVDHGIDALGEIHTRSAAKVEEEIAILDNAIRRAQERIRHLEDTETAASVAAARPRYEHHFNEALAAIETAKRNLWAIKHLNSEVRQSDAFGLPRGSIGANVSDLVRLLLTVDIDDIRTHSAPGFVPPMAQRASEPTDAPENYAGRFYKGDTRPGF